jgi:hypothetical protein
MVLQLMGPRAKNQVDYMSIKSLGFSSLTYSEVLLTLKLEETINSAPMGILLDSSGEPHLRVYKGQKTCDLLISGARDCVLNITDDPVLFYNAIFKKDEIPYLPAKRVSSPRIRGCHAYVECSIKKVSAHSEYVEVFLKPLLIEVSDRTVRTYNRAGPAIIEALVCYTRLLHFKDIDREEAQILKGRIEMFRDIVYHSTRDQVLRRMATDILERAEEALAGSAGVSRGISSAEER